MTSENPLKKSIVTLYALYIGAAFLSMLPNMTCLVLSLAIIIFAIIQSYQKRRVAEGTIYYAHAVWQIRTFWWGGAVLMPIATVLFTILIYPDMQGVLTTLSVSEEALSDPALAQQEVTQALFEKIGDTLVTMALLTFGPIYLWWYARCLKGMVKAVQGQTIEQPGRFV